MFATITMSLLKSTSNMQSQFYKINTKLHRYIDKTVFMIIVIIMLVISYIKSIYCTILKISPPPPNSVLDIAQTGEGAYFRRVPVILLRSGIITMLLIEQL